MADGVFVAVAGAVLLAALWLLAKVHRRLDRWLDDQVCRTIGAGAPTHDRHPDADWPHRLNEMTVDELWAAMRAVPLNYAELRDGDELRPYEREMWVQVLRAWADPDAAVQPRRKGEL